MREARILPAWNVQPTCHHRDVVVKTMETPGRVGIYVSLVMSGMLETQGIRGILETVVMLPGPTLLDERVPTTVATRDLLPGIEPHLRLSWLVALARGPGTHLPLHRRRLRARPSPTGRSRR